MIYYLLFIMYVVSAAAAYVKHPTRYANIMSVFIIYLNWHSSDRPLWGRLLGGDRRFFTTKCIVGYSGVQSIR